MVHNILLIIYVFSHQGVADKLANEDHRQVFRPRKENLKSPNLPVTEGVIWNPEEQVGWGWCRVYPLSTQMEDATAAAKKQAAA